MDEKVLTTIFFVLLLSIPVVIDRYYNVNLDAEYYHMRMYRYGIIHSYDPLPCGGTDVTYPTLLYIFAPKHIFYANIFFLFIFCILSKKYAPLLLLLNPLIIQRVLAVSYTHLTLPTN